MSFIITVFYLLGGILLGLFIVQYGEHRNSDGIAALGGTCIMISVLVLLVYFIGIPISYHGQINDVESITSQANKIEIQRDRLERLSTILEQYNYPESTTLANGDSPVASVVEEISTVEGDIAQRRESIENIKRNIRSRKAWVFGFVTEWYSYKQE